MTIGTPHPPDLSSPNNHRLRQASPNNHMLKQASPNNHRLKHATWTNVVHASPHRDADFANPTSGTYTGFYKTLGY